MKIRRPIFIISSPRSGSSLLFKLLSESPELWSSYRESHYLWQKFLKDKRDPIFSMYLDEKDFKNTDQEELENLYHLNTFNNESFGELTRVLFFREKLKPLFKSYLHLNKFFKENILKLNDYRIIDKTPPNVFRIKYLNKLFPDAKYIFLTRDGRANISSLIDAWLSDGKLFDFKFREFHEYNSRLNINGYSGKVWKFLNPPNWEEYLSGKSIEEVCAFQWLSANEYALNAFSEMASEKYLHVRYEDILANRVDKIKAICDFCEIDFSSDIQRMIDIDPQVSVVSAPRLDKWLKNKDKIDRISAQINNLQEKLGYPSSQPVSH
jgi:hypothetical protein